MANLNRLRNFVRGILGKPKLDSIEFYRQKGVKVGENVLLIRCKIDLHMPRLLSIGNNTTIVRSSILVHDASLNKTLGYTKYGKVEIGDNVFIGLGSIILPNVKIGNRVVVGAGSVVSKDIPDNSVAVGNPCRVIGTFDEYFERQRKNLENRPVFDKKSKTATLDEVDCVFNSGRGFSYFR